jgi:MoxR-like ATPase
LHAEDVLALQRGVREVVVADSMLRYASQLVRASRPGEPNTPTTISQYVRWGAGPRAGQALILGAKASAFLDGRAAVSPDDIRRVAHPVLRHRVLPNFAAEADGISADAIVDVLLAHIAPPASGMMG